MMRRFWLAGLTLALAPAFALLALGLLLLNLTLRLVRAVRQPAPVDETPPDGLASLIILNWNGKDLLAQGIPSVIEAVARDGQPHEILVVDNGSTDGSAAYLRENFPQVRVLALAENLGFTKGNNAGVRAARHEIAILLNNDMVVDPGFLRPLLSSFGPRTFAVTSQIRLQDPLARREETGRTVAVFRRGMIDYAHQDVDERKLERPLYPVFYAGGGSSAFRRGRFLALGGFQDIFSPAYVEDTDISFRAWKSGWDVLLAPASIVYHKHRATSSRSFTPAGLQELIQRNQLLFIWKNLAGWRLLISHIIFLPWNSYRLARDHGLRLWRSLMQAASRIPALLAAEWRSPYREARTDMEIFRLFEKPARYFARPRPQAEPHGTERQQPPRVLWMTAYLPHMGRHAGAGRMYQLLVRMAGRYRITLLSFLENEEEREFLPELEAVCEKVVAMKRIRPPRLQLFPYEPFDEFLTREMMQAMQASLEEREYDLIQLEYTQMASYADRTLGIPSLLTKHEVDFAACARRARLEPTLPGKIRWFYNYLQVLDREIALLRRVNAAVCMTDPDARHLLKYCSSIPVQVINTGVDLDYFTPPERPAGAPRLVFVGAFRHDPNVDAMMYFCEKVLPLVRAEIADVVLDIVGSHPTASILALQSIPGVQVTGFVPDVRPYMARSSAYIVPLRLGVGIRGKILEAWAMAMPVVATHVACAGLRCRNGENIMIADHPADFAAAVIALLKDPGLRDLLGRAGRSVAEQHYSWEASARRLDRLYQDLLKGQEPVRDWGKETA
jgi:GT2 family glycosyltransferase